MACSIGSIVRIQDWGCYSDSVLYIWVQLWSNTENQLARLPLKILVVLVPNKLHRVFQSWVLTIKVLSIRILRIYFVQIIFIQNVQQKIVCELCHRFSTYPMPGLKFNFLFQSQIISNVLMESKFIQQGHPKKPNNNTPYEIGKGTIF